MELLHTYEDIASEYIVPTVFFKYLNSTYWCNPAEQEDDESFDKCTSNYCNPDHKLFCDMKLIIK